MIIPFFLFLAAASAFVVSAARAEGGIDYLALVNRLRPLPKGWESALETVTVVNPLGERVEVEKKTFEAYTRLRADLEKKEGIFPVLDSGRRTVAAQREIMDRFTEKYGADYAAKTVAPPGFSEHHTGLALDVCFRVRNVDGSFSEAYSNEDMTRPEYERVWARIHARLADYGFILRYPKGKEHITGYGYEPWHIRYVGSAETAREIMARPGMTLEVWLGAAADTDPAVDYGTSALYTREELEAAVVQIKCRFAAFSGCRLISLRYAGDPGEAGEAPKLTSAPGGKEEPVQTVTFLSRFRSPVHPDAGSPREPGREYTDCEWRLSRTAGGGWRLLS